MTTAPLTDVPVRSAADLTARWAAVLDPPRFAARSLWLLWLTEAGGMLPVVMPVDGLPRRPDRRMIRGLLELHDTVAAEAAGGDAHLALALCRPGSPTVTADDDEWAEALRELLDPFLEGTWSLHLAAGGRVVPLVPAPERMWRGQRPPAP